MRPLRPALSLAVAGVLVATSAQALPGPADDQAPVLSRELARGISHTVVLGEVSPSAKTIDGDPSDWIGEATGFGGTLVRSAGELVYTDHLFDAYGADDGGDAERLERLGLLEDVDGGFHRVDPLYQQDLAGEFGAPAPDSVRGDFFHGDGGFTPTADLAEVRLAATQDHLLVLARTTTMTEATDLRLRVVLDGVVHDIGGGLTPAAGVTVAVDPSGWVNTLEASIPIDGAAGSVDVAIASLDPAGEVSNVAFRTAEPVRMWFERDQALGLYASGGDLDPFAIEVDLDALRAGVDEAWVPGPGYHDRVFVSTDDISTEAGTQGIRQHYGLFLPASWDPVADSDLALQWWFHWRGGEAHSAGTVIPRMFRDLGDELDAVVVAPRGRGTSNWYVGASHLDVLQVWDDVESLLGGDGARFGDRVDWDRVYVTGHSMGGWASWLLPILYPDRFAATVPYAGPVTQGAWTGVDAEGCDQFAFDDYTPCYISANDSRPRDQHTLRLLENLRNVGVAEFHGAADELVPVSGEARQMARLAELGYRHRWYVTPVYEHYSHPAVDQWSEGGRYAHQFTIDRNPAEVVYIRDLAFESALEEVRSFGADLDFDVDSAYWMSDLEVAPGAERAVFRGRNLARPDSHVAIPDTAPPVTDGQHGPFLVTGLQWVDTTDVAPVEVLVNGVSLVLDGASAVTVDPAAMGLDPSAAFDLRVATTHDVTVHLVGLGSHEFAAGTSTLHLNVGS